MRYHTYISSSEIPSSALYSLLRVSFLFAFFVQSDVLLKQIYVELGLTSMQIVNFNYVGGLALFIPFFLIFIIIPSGTFFYTYLVPFFLVIRVMVMMALVSIYNKSNLFFFNFNTYSTEERNNAFLSVLFIESIISALYYYSDFSFEYQFGFFAWSRRGNFLNPLYYILFFLGIKSFFIGLNLLLSFLQFPLINILLAKFLFLLFVESFCAYKIYADRFRQNYTDNLTIGIKDFLINPTSISVVSHNVIYFCILFFIMTGSILLVSFLRITDTYINKYISFLLIPGILGFIILGYLVASTTKYIFIFFILMQTIICSINSIPETLSSFAGLISPFSNKPLFNISSESWYGLHLRGALFISVPAFLISKFFNITLLILNKVFLSIVTFCFFCFITFIYFFRVNLLESIITYFLAIFIFTLIRTGFEGANLFTNYYDERDTLKRTYFLTYGPFVFPGIFHSFSAILLNFIDRVSPTPLLVDSTIICSMLYYFFVYFISMILLLIFRRSIFREIEEAGREDLLGLIKE